MNLSQPILVGAQGGAAVAVAGFFSLAAMLYPVAPQRPMAGVSVAAMSPATHVTAAKIPLTDWVEPTDPAAEQALRHKVQQLIEGRKTLQRIPSYEGTFRKQELVNGELLEPQTIFLRCRHQPFSVYLLWEEGDQGREVLYVQGRNDGKLLAHDGGWKSRLPALSLAPEGSLAMSSARYPVTQAGLMGLIDQMLSVHQQDLESRNYRVCLHQRNVAWQGHTCDVFTLLYTDPTASPQYRKSVTLIEQQRHLPVSTRHYGWPSADSNIPVEDLDAQTLLEAYEFDGLDFGQRLTDADFDAKNPNYRFH